MRQLIAILAFAFTASFVSPALAVPIPALELRNVTQNAGRSVSAYIASGKPARFEKDGGIPVIGAIEAGPLEAAVGTTGAATVPAIGIPRARLGSFNYLVIVVHEGSQPMWIGNANAEDVIYLPLELDRSRRSVTQIGSAKIKSNLPLALDLSLPAINSSSQ